MEFKKRDLLVEDNSEEGIIKRVLSKLKGIRDRAQSEIKETRALVRILTHAVKSYTKDREFDLNDEDRKFIKGQSADVVRGLILTIVAMIPLPIPLTPFLIIFGKKIGIDLVPKQQEIPSKGKPKKDNLDESKKLNILITDEQYRILSEMSKKYKNVLHKLCVNQKENKPFCALYKLGEKLVEDDRVELEVAMEVLDYYFRYKNVGMLPVIVDLALQDEGRTVNYLKLISDFIQDDKYDKTETKKVLNKQRNSKEIPKDLESLLKTARTLEHQKYEQSLEGEHFKKKATFLRLNHYCEDDAKETLFNILTKVKSEERSLDIAFDQITRCIQKSFTQGSYYIKADVVTQKNLTCSGETIFPSNTNFEVKKMDPFIDSYLSEFFSIFKETEKIAFKGEYVGLYNELIQRIFEWIQNNPDAEKYLEKVKSQMGGIIYDYQTIVPIEYIDLYWSNKGQRGCDEKRLSIRFKIKESVNEIPTYRYKKQDELEPIIKKVPYNEKEKVICQ
jgi:hypothetical protein